ncbi:hypothetical protein ACKGJN_15590 [Gillisia sp. Q332]
MSPDDEAADNPNNPWQPLCAGMDDAIIALTQHEDNLIAGGWFEKAGEV